MHNLVKIHLWMLSILKRPSQWGTCSLVPLEKMALFHCSLKPKSWFSKFPVPQNCLCSPAPLIFKSLFPCSPEKIDLVPLFPKTRGSASLILTTSINGFWPNCAHALMSPSQGGTCFLVPLEKWPCSPKPKSWFSMFPVPQNCLCSPYFQVFVPMFPLKILPLFPCFLPPRDGLFNIYHISVWIVKPPFLSICYRITALE